MCHLASVTGRQCLLCRGVAELCLFCACCDVAAWFLFLALEYWKSCICPFRMGAKCIAILSPGYLNTARKRTAFLRDELPADEADRGTGDTVRDHHRGKWLAESLTQLGSAEGAKTRHHTQPSQP